VLKNITISEAKEQIAKAVGFSLDAEDKAEQLKLLRLRRKVKSDGLGNLLYDEQLEVRQVEGLDDGATIILEKEPLPQPGQVLLQFFHLTKGWDYDAQQPRDSEASEPQELIFDETLTLVQCKEEMCTKLGAQVVVSNVRLRYCLLQGGERGPGKLLSNEDMTLAKAKLRNGDMLVVEDGRPPVKGLILVKLFIVVPNGRGIGCAPTPDGAKGDELSDEMEPNPSHHSGQIEQIEMLVSLQVGEKLSLLGFKEKLVQLPEFNARTLGFANGEPPTRLRIHQLEAGQVLGPVYRDHTLTLKSLNIFDGSSLAVRLLNHEEDLSSNSAVLKVQRRIPSEYNYEETREVVIDAKGSAVSSTFLARELGIHFGIEESNVLLAVRQEGEENPWKILRHEVPQGQGSASKKKGKKKGKSVDSADQPIANVLKPQWNVKDMSIIAIKDVSLECDTSEVDNFLCMKDLDAGAASKPKRRHQCKESGEEVALSLSTMAMPHRAPKNIASGGESL